MTPLLSLSRAARALGLSARALRGRIEGGLIEAVEVPARRGKRVWKVQRATVDALHAARWCSKAPDAEVEL